MIEGALFERIALAYRRRRATAAVTREGDRWLIPSLPEATVGQVRLWPDTVIITPDSGDVAAPLRGDPPTP